MVRTETKAPKRAGETWRLMFSFFMHTSPERVELLQKRGLTPNDSRVLFLLGRAGKPIGALAKELACDPSTATWLVDRLERLGLAERRPSDLDGRVKLVALTVKGTRSKQEILDAYHQPPPELGMLSGQELDTLRTIFGKLQTREVHPKRKSRSGE